MGAPSAVALVPARAGSQRIPGKNVALLAGHPLLAYAIGAAYDSGVFAAVIVSTDSEQIAEVARRYGAEVPELRPAEMSTATSFDIEWVLHAMRNRDEEIFAIIRPTSPFRTGETIRRAFAQLVELGDRADSIRAVEPARQHPAKMWTLSGDLVEPLLPQPEDETPLHSRQYQALPKVYVQNSSLELAWSRVLEDPVPTISGRRVAPFFTEGAEGFSIDYPDDLARAERMVAGREAVLPSTTPPRVRELLDLRLPSLVRVDQPLVLISQVQRSGGTLLLRLLDGHPECHVVPFQLRGIDEAAKRSLIDPAEAWDVLYDPKLAERAGGHRQQKYDVLQDEDIHAFGLSTELQRAIYDACAERAAGTRDLLDCYLTAYFNGWEDYANLDTGAKRWVVGFEPGVALSMRRRQALRDVYPEGRIVSIVRDPWSWFASARRWEPRWRDRELALDEWCRAAIGTWKWRDRIGKKVVRLIGFDYLLSQTEETMQRLASWLGIEARPELLQPTFNGVPIRANTSFADVDTDVSTKPLERAREHLDAEDVAYIEERAGAIYKRLLKRVENDRREESAKKKK